MVLETESCCAWRRQKVVQEGADALPGRVVIVTGKSRSKEDEAGTAAKEAVVAVLSAARSPFQVKRTTSRAEQSCETMC